MEANGRTLLLLVKMSEQIIKAVDKGVVESIFCMYEMYTRISLYCIDHFISFVQWRC